VVYDGAVGHPEPGSQWDLVARHGVTVFGTNPGYLQLCRDTGVEPHSRCDLSTLRLVMSTGAILPAGLFHWVRDSVKTVPVHSTSGGTDIMGAWLLGNPNLPVRAGELQCIGLGLDVAAAPMPGISEGPLPSDVTARGDLVCRRPFPSRPVGLLGDPDRSRFHDTWFSQHPGWWTHGDLVEFTVHGGGRILGRSDGILNVRGIRIGPAEIYAALRGTEGVSEVMAVEQRTPELPGGSRLVLLVRLAPGRELDHDLTARIRKTIRDRCSPSHVPGVIAEVGALPRTRNGKLSERAATDAVNGRPVANRDALQNPESLEALARHPALQHDGGTASVQEAGRLGQLTSLWTHVLGTDVEPDDEFFETGGDSLRGLYLLNAVERQFGVRLPMSSLLVTARTPRQMDEVLEARAAGDPRALLVPLHSADRGRPVFWFPGGGGMSVLAFRPIAAAVGSGPVIGLEARLDGPPPADLAEMVQEYVDAVVAFDPVGPYRLFGFSFGAFAAFEAAHQLAGRGATVDALVLFDAALPLHLTPWQRCRGAVQRAAYHARRLVSLPGEEKLAHLTGALNVARKRVRMAVRPGKAHSWRDHAGGEPDLENVFDARDRHNRLLAERYRHGPLHPWSGPIHLVLAGRTSKSALSPDLDPRMGWRHLARGGLVVHHVSGSHLSMLTGAGVPELAATLRGILAGLADR
jgi:acetoacetyl-CoA synthetase